MRMDLPNYQFELFSKALSKDSTTIRDFSKLSQNLFLKSTLCIRFRRRRFHTQLQYPLTLWDHLRKHPIRPH